MSGVESYRELKNLRKKATKEEKELINIKLKAIEHKRAVELASKNMLKILVDKRAVLIKFKENLETKDAA